MSQGSNQPPRSIVLTRDEIAEICSPLQRFSAQTRLLERLGLKVARRADGSPLVSRQEFERVMSGAPAKQEEEYSGIRWPKGME
ncbi:hypothetical protein D3C87_782660 [compost metagenome]